MSNKIEVKVKDLIKFKQIVHANVSYKGEMIASAMGNITPMHYYNEKHYNSLGLRLSFDP